MKRPTKIVLVLLCLAVLACVLFARPAIKYLDQERAHLKEKSRKVELSYYFPDFDALARHVAAQEDLETSPTAYLAYYLKTQEMYPELKDIYPLQGFFYAKDKKSADAIGAFEKAIRNNPHYFWAYYNLALLYHQNGEWKKSNAVIRQALSLKPAVTLYVINQSSLYRQIWRHIPDAEKVITRNLKRGFEDCLGLLIVNLYELKEYQALLQVAAQAAKGDYSRKDFVTSYAKLAVEELKGAKETAPKPVPPKDTFDFRLF